LVGLVGWSATGTAQDQQAQNAFSYSLEEGDLFRVRFLGQDQTGDPATQTIPADCLDGDEPDEEPQEFQILIVRAFRNGINLGYQGLFVPQEAVATEAPETTPEETTPGEKTIPEETTPEETTPADEETTPTQEETTPAEEPELPEIRLGEWYRVTISGRCVDLNQLTLETAEQPETTPGPEETTPEE
jgi:hypothetical protein